MSSPQISILIISPSQSAKLTKMPDITDNEKLKALSCPFTWGLENVIENRHRLLEAGENRFEMVVDIRDNFPEFVVIEL